MKSLAKRKSLFVILSAFCAVCMLFAGLSVKKASADVKPATLETVALTTTMESSASMRLTDPTGMRFTANVKESDIQKFNADNVKVVIMITQKKLLDEAGLTIAEFNKDSAVTKAEVPFTKAEFPTANEGTVKLIATILRVQDVNIAKTYVAKTYITDGEKIGYVEQATEASIYEVASYWANQDLYKNNADAMAILQGYSKSFSVSVNGAETVKVPYYSEVSELFADLPACTTVKTIVDGNSQPVALTAPVTADLALTVEYDVKHAWDNGECTHCEEVCEHSWTNGVCDTCKLACEHTSYKDFLCVSCAQPAPTTYNETNDLSGLKALGNAHGTGTNSGLYTATVALAGGKTGNFFRVHLAYNSNGLGVEHVGISIKPDVTLAQLNALKNAGYMNLSADYYFEHKGDKEYSYKWVCTGGVYTYGNTEFAFNTLKEKKNLGEWYNFTVAIQDIIDNYEGLTNGTKYLMHIINSQWYGDNGDYSNRGHFYAYIGNIKFVMDEKTATTYNETNDLSDLKALGNAHGTGTNSGLYTATVTSAGEKTGNFFRVHLAYNSNGLGVEHVGISIKPDVTLAQLNALKNEGYTKLSADYYFEHKGDKEYSYKWVCTGGVYTYGNTEFAFNTLKEKKNLGEWYNFTVEIQDIIDNYEGLTNGTKYLMHIINSQWYSDNGNAANRGHFYAYIGNMKFI